METKTIEQILDQVCEENLDTESFNETVKSLWQNEDVDWGLKNISQIVKEAMKLYAEQYAYQKCEEQIKACNANVELDVLCQHGYGVITEGSILNTPNVCNPKTN